MIDHDLDVFFLGVLEFPFRRLEEATRLARHDLDVLCAETQRRAATVHRRVADTDNENALADAVDVVEGDRLEPLDANMNTVRIISPGYFEVLAFRRARADEDGVITLFEKCLHAVDALP